MSPARPPEGANSLSEGRREAPREHQMNTPVSMPTPLGKPKVKPQVVKEDAMWLQKELINKNYMELASARENNRKVAATFVPGNLNELLMCFDFARSLPETNALLKGMRT